MEEVQQHYTLTEAARLLGGVTTRTVRNWIADGKASRGKDGIWPAYQLNRKTVIVPASSIRRFLEARKA